MMSRYLDPTNDIAFKKLFSDPERLIGFLNGILKREEGEKIVRIEYIPQEQIPDLGQVKRSIVDVKCYDQMGNNYIIEMQNGKAEAFLKRVQFYSCSAYTNQLKKGKTHIELAPVIVIVITSHYAYFPPEVPCISSHRIIETCTNKQYLKDLSYIFIDLDKFTKRKEELENVEDFWLYFFVHWDEIKDPPEVSDKALLSAYETMERFNWSAEAYDNYLRAKLYADTEFLNLQKEREEGKAEGRVQEKLEIARNLLNKGMKITDIQDITGLSSDQIKELN